MNRNTRHIFAFLITLALCTTLNGQDTLQVQGLIRGINKIPIAGASVSVEGILMAPVITDSTGTFLIPVPDLEVTLLISPMGAYKAKKIYLNKRDYLELTLSPEDLLDGQDQTAYIFYEKELRDFASSASFPETDLLQKVPESSVESYFKGQVPGMWTTGMSGMPGSGAVSFLRGMKSMYANTQPL